MLAIRSTRPAAATLLASLLLSACSSGSVSAPPRTAGQTVGGASVSMPVRRPAPGAVPLARLQSIPGIEGVIGATPTELARQFGTPRLDVWEGDARKLQFSGTPCVLDVYLYPLAPGRDPQATYVDARRPSDGRDVDRADCIRGLRRR